MVYWLYPIGSMYAIYGNIYHQYTPVMLAYIPAPWILWVLIAWAYCSQFAFGGCASLPLARCHRTVIVCHRCPSPGTNGWFSWLTCFDGASNHCLSPTIPTVFCTPLGRYDLSHCVQHPLCHHLAGLASSKQWEKLTTNAFSTTLNKTISINFLKKRRTVICERYCADLFFFDVVHCLFCAFCKGNLLNSLRCLAQSWNKFTKKGLGSRTGKGMQRKTEFHCRKRFGTEVLPLTLLLYIPLSSCLSQLTLH